jgi:hypothetical protein
MDIIGKTKKIEQIITFTDSTARWEKRVLEVGSNSCVFVYRTVITGVTWRSEIMFILTNAF